MVPRRDSKVSLSSSVHREDEVCGVPSCNDPDATAAQASSHSPSDRPSRADRSAPSPRAAGSGEDGITERSPRRGKVFGQESCTLRSNHVRIRTEGRKDGCEHRGLLARRMPKEETIAMDYDVANASHEIKQGLVCRCGRGIFVDDLQRIDEEGRLIFIE